MAIWKRRAERQAGDPPAAAAQPERPVAVAPRADFLDATAAMRASLGSDAVVNGRLSFTSPTRIDGTLRGEVRSSDLLVVGETGFVEGTIRATTLVLLGTLKGHILGAERVEIGAQASVRGTIEARVLRVQEGASIDGDCRVGPTRARVHVLAARAAGGDAAETLDESLAGSEEDPPTGSG
jgi:cytoskeletal protein CcmA (bactofilin family)